MNSTSGPLDFAAINQSAVELGRTIMAQKSLSAHPPGRVLFSAISGGHMYGFPSPDSDLDVRGCHVLSLEDVIGLQAPKETFELMGEWVEGVEIDWVSHDLRKYLGLLMKNGGYILEQIFSPLVIEEGEYLGELRQLGRDAMTRRVHHHYHGFFRRQREIVALERPLHAKSVLYMFRVVMSGIHLLQTGRVETDIKVLDQAFEIPYLEDLWLAKCMDREKATVAESERETYLADADQLAERMSDAVARSPLPEELQNRAALDDFLRRQRLGPK